jgi:predicted dehydrogenase
VTEGKDRLVTLLVVGGGNRGTVYSNFALDFPDRLKVIGVVEPRPARRALMARNHNLTDTTMIFEDWKQAIEAGATKRLADAVVIATPDQLHRDPAVAFAAQGYQILLEKPMAVTKQDCEDIAKACNEHKVILAVGHVLR